MIYILMCGGNYEKWRTPRQLTKINGEPIIERTIRLLRENGVENIAISTDIQDFDYLMLPIVTHSNTYRVRGYNDVDGRWTDGFYPIKRDSVCYIFGDVIFSPEAIKTIVETPTDDIEFFASAPPFDERFPKKYAEPFAFKVVNTDKFWDSIERVDMYSTDGLFYRHPIAWELWQVIKRTPLNIIDYTNYTVINDYTCDIDEPEDIKFYEGLIND